MSFLEVEGITKKFGGLTAVNKVSFRVEKGEIDEEDNIYNNDNFNDFSVWRICIS